MSTKSGQTQALLRLVRLSQSSRYALQGMLFLARRPRSFGLAMDAAKSRRLPGNFLAKIFQRLARQGVLVSQRGPGGGYALARDPAAIRLLDIVLAVEDFPSGPRACLLEPRVCGVDGPCAIHAAVRRADRALLEALKKTTLADLGG